SAGEPVDYVSAGPVEPTPTKPGRPGTGLDYVRLAAERSPHPFFVTGGVSPAPLPAIAAAGATRFVVVRAPTEAVAPAAVAAELRRLLGGRPGLRAVDRAKGAGGSASRSGWRWPSGRGGGGGRRRPRCGGRRCRSRPRTGPGRRRWGRPRRPRRGSAAGAGGRSGWPIRE